MRSHGEQSGVRFVPCILRAKRRFGREQRNGIRPIDDGSENGENSYGTRVSAVAYCCIRLF